MRDLVVILGVFLCAAVVAMLLALPVWRWAEAAPSEWRFWPAVIWAMAAYVFCAWLAMRALEKYRHWSASVGRSQKS